MGNKHGEVHWSELMTRNIDAAKAYYAEVCGWQFQEMPMPNGTYHLAMTGEGPACGLFPMDGPEFEGAPETWMTYIAVDDVDKAAEQTRKAGGAVQQEPFDIPSVGRIAMVTDPTGVMVGLMTPAEQ